MQSGTVTSPLMLVECSAGLYPVEEISIGRKVVAEKKGKPRGKGVVMNTVLLRFPAKKKEEVGG